MMMQYRQDGFPKGRRTGEHHEAPNGDKHRFYRQLTRQAGRDGGGNDTAQDHSGDVPERDGLQEYKKVDGTCQYDKDLRQAYRADDKARVFSFGDQGAGNE